jgi:GTP-binding protein
VAEAVAGDIVAITGIEDVNIGSPSATRERGRLPPISVDEPTLSMNFQVNTSPLAGREGKYVTSRQIRERLYRELQSNVALRVEDTAEPDVFRVSGRGELHLTILIENMRREGYELAVGARRCSSIVDGEVHEPYEALTVDIDEGHQGAVMEALGTRRAELTDMASITGRVRLEYRVPARGLIGFQGEFMTTDPRHRAHQPHFRRLRPGERRYPRAPQRRAHQQRARRGGGLLALQPAGARPHVREPEGEKLYEGMIIGIHSRENDLVVNPIKTKKLTNIRAAGKDDAILLTPPIQLTLEYAVEFIAEDELVEVTPESIRIRKRFLSQQKTVHGADLRGTARAPAESPRPGQGQ